MAIAPLRKVTLIGRLADRDDIVVGMQRLACMHVIDLAGVDQSPSWEHPTHSDLFAALKYLKRCPTRRGAINKGVQQDVGELAREVLHNRDRRRELRDQQEALREAIALTAPWGEFILPPAEALGGCKIWFYRLRHRDLDRLPADLPRRVISRDREFTHVAVIADRPAENLPPPLKLDGRPLSELRQELVDVERNIESIEVERIALTRWIDLLEQNLVEAEQEIERVRITEQLFRDEPVVAMQGWVAVDALPDLQDFAKQQGLAMMECEPRLEDQPPTMLKNPAPINGAEETVTFFMTPRYGAWDPTLVMYLSFSLFFAMIMADAGYGLVLAAGLIAFSPRLRKTESGRRFLNLATFMVGVTIVYGVMIGSYFGIAPAAGSLPDLLVLKSGGEPIVNNREAMMLVSASIGVFHLVLANLIVAWKKRSGAQAFSHLGWVAFLLGGWMMILAEVPTPPIAPWLAETFGGQGADWTARLWSGGQWLLGSGLLLVASFSSSRPLWSKNPIDWLMRPVDGLLGLTNATKAFGDALSYLRLFALGLASGQLAMVFNELASDVSKTRGIGLLLGLLIFVAGHTLNLVLAIVGGVVHGLRLNCIEFFSWSLNEEGRPFQAFGARARDR